MPTYICLKCGHIYETEKHYRFPQCMNYKCRSTLVLPYDTYMRIINELEKRGISPHTPFLDVVIAYGELVDKKGIDGRILRNLEMARLLVEHVERRKRGEQP